MFWNLLICGLLSIEVVSQGCPYNYRQTDYRGCYQYQSPPAIERTPNSAGTSGPLGSCTNPHLCNEDPNGSDKEPADYSRTFKTGEYYRCPIAVQNLDILCEDALCPGFNFKRDITDSTCCDLRSSFGCTLDFPSFPPYNGCKGTSFATYLVVDANKVQGCTDCMDPLTITEEAVALVPNSDAIEGRFSNTGCPTPTPTKLPTALATPAPTKSPTTTRATPSPTATLTTVTPTALTTNSSTSLSTASIVLICAGSAIVLGICYCNRKDLGETDEQDPSKKLVLSTTLHRTAQL